KNLPRCNVLEAKTSNFKAVLDSTLFPVVTVQLLDNLTYVLGIFTVGLLKKGLEFNQVLHERYFRYFTLAPGVAEHLGSFCVDANHDSLLLSMRSEEHTSELQSRE